MTTATSSTSSTSAYQCHWCERISEKKLLKCGTCLVARYCDQRCQIVHWPEHKKVCHSPHNATTDVTKNVISKTLLNNAQAEQTTGPFNHLNNTLTSPPPPSGEAKKEDSMPSSWDSSAKCRTPSEILEMHMKVEKEQAALDRAIDYLSEGNTAAASVYVFIHTSLPYMRRTFITHLATVLCGRDKKNLSMVVNIAPVLLTEGWKECVIKALCDAKIFESRKAIEKELLTTDVTKNVISKTLLNNAQAEQTTGPFNHLHNTLTSPPPPSGEAKKEASMPTSFDLAQIKRSLTLLLGDPALSEKEKPHLNNALILLKNKEVTAACNYIVMNSSQPLTKIEFIYELAKHMCDPDKKNIKQVLSMSTPIFPGGLSYVLDRLVANKIFASREEILQLLKNPTLN